MRWQDAMPGIERAQCVPRPVRHKSDMLHGDYIRTGHDRTDGMRFFVGVSTHDFVDGISITRFHYDDDSPRSRVISAERVEKAVETQTFLDICATEKLAAVWGAEGWTVIGTAKGRTTKTLRGAYVSYHGDGKKKEASDDPGQE